MKENCNYQSFKFITYLANQITWLWFRKYLQRSRTWKVKVHTQREYIELQLIKMIFLIGKEGLRQVSTTPSSMICKRLHEKTRKLLTISNFCWKPSSPQSMRIKQLRITHLHLLMSTYSGRIVMVRQTAQLWGKFYLKNIVSAIELIRSIYTLYRSSQYHEFSLNQKFIVL